MWNACRIRLCCEARDESSSHYSVSCESLATLGVTIRGNVTSVDPPLQYAREYRTDPWNIEAPTALGRRTHSKLEEIEPRPALGFKVLTEEDLVQWPVVIEPEDEEDFDTHMDKVQPTTRVL